MNDRPRLALRGLVFLKSMPRRIGSVGSVKFAWSERARERERERGGGGGGGVSEKGERTRWVGNFLLVSSPSKFYLRHPSPNIEDDGIERQEKVTDNKRYRGVPAISTTQVQVRPPFFFRCDRSDYLLGRLCRLRFQSFFVRF